MPLFAASVLPTQLRTLICRLTGAVMDVETVDLGKLVAERRSEGAPPPELTAIAAAPMPVLLLPNAAAPDVRPVRPPTVGPPLLLLKRSFLI